MDYSYLKSKIENCGHIILQIARHTNNIAIAELANEVLDKLHEERSCLAVSWLFKNDTLRSAWNKLEKSASDLMTYLLLVLNSLTTPLDIVHLELEFKKHLDLVEQRKRELFSVLEGRVKDIVNMLDEDLAVFKKEHEAALVKQIEEFAEEKLKLEKANFEEVVDDVKAYLRKVLAEVFSDFIRQENVKARSLFQKLANEANEKTNDLVGNLKQKTAELFEFRVISLVFHSPLNFETKSYYRMDPPFTVDITFSASAMEKLPPKSMSKGILKKRMQEIARTEFAKNCARARDHFIIRLDQAVMKLKKDINCSFEASAETVKQAIFEAKQLRTKNENEVFTSFIVLNRLLAQLRSVIKQFEMKFELKGENPKVDLE